MEVLFVRFLRSNKVLTTFGNTTDFYFRIREAKTAFLAVRKWRPSWRGQNSLVTSRVVSLSCRAGILE